MKSEFGKLADWLRSICSFDVASYDEVMPYR